MTRDKNPRKPKQPKQPGERKTMEAIAANEGKPVSSGHRSETFCAHTRRWWQRGSRCGICNAAYSETRAAALRSKMEIAGFAETCAACGERAYYMTPRGAAYCPAHKDIARNEMASNVEPWVNALLRQVRWSERNPPARPDVAGYSGPKVADILRSSSAAVA